MDIFRLHFDDVVGENMEGETGFPVLLDPWVKAGLCKITQTEIKFWNNSLIALEHCFTGDTKIQTTKGAESLLSLLGRRRDVKIAEDKIAPIRNVRKIQESVPIVEVMFEDGSSYKCTPDHKFITTSGLVEAKDLLGVECLTNESSLLAIQSKYSKGKDLASTGNISARDLDEGAKSKKCVGVRSAGIDDVYCLTVPACGYFPLSNGVLVLNCADDVVMLKHRGIARHVRTFGESTQILEHRVRALTGWVTMSDEMKARVPENWKGLFPKVYHVTNPTGVSAGYYRKQFVDARPPYSIEKIGQFQRQYIPMFLDDNDAEDAEATKARIREAFQDEATQKAFINEDKSGISNWHTGGGEFFPEWDRARHVVRDFTPPDWWFHYRSMDIGWSEPTAVYYIAVSDGYPFRDEFGRERWFPRGARIFYRELYLCDAKNHAKGLGLSNKEMAQRIIEQSELKHRRVPTLTDSKPFQGTGTKTPAEEFAAEGVELLQVNTGPGSRVAGWSIMRSALIGQYEDGFQDKVPMVFFCACCTFACDYIPALPRHPLESKKEDAAESGEATHSNDAIRYGLLGHEVIKGRAPELTKKMIDQELASPAVSIKTITKRLGSNIFK